MAGNILLKGYTAALANVLTTELNSLADGTVTALGSQVDNTTNLDMVVDFQLDLASLTISSANAYVNVYIVPTIDGTNYPDSVTTYANFMAGYLVGSIPVKAVSATTARATLTGILIGPGKFKVAVRSMLGVSMAASGNTLGIRAYANSYT